MIKDLALRISPRFDGAQATKGLTEQSRLIRDQKKALDEIDKQHATNAKNATGALRGLHSVAETTGRGIRSAFSMARDEVAQFGKGISEIKSKLINLKTVVAGSLIGGIAIAGVNKLLEGGNAVLRARARTNREFGADAPQVQALARQLAQRSGVSDEDALRALIPIAEATQETQAGVSYRGRRLNVAQANALRAQTTQFGANLLTRISTVTGENPQDIAQALAEAGSGPEGVRRYAALIGANRVFAREANAANEKGQLQQFLRQHGGQRFIQQFGIKAGQQAGQGTLLDLIAQQSGITDQAAEAKRRTFAFQRQSITSQLGNVLGDVGASALDKLTNGLGKGKTLAEKLQEALASPKGKEAIEKISGGIAKFVEMLLKVPAELGKIIGFISAHKTAFEVIGGIVGGGFIAAKGIGLGKSVIGGAKDVLGAFGIGGKGKGLLGGGDIGGKPIPVYVVNAPDIGSKLPGLPGGASGLLAKAGLVAGAGALGYAAGTYLDNKFGLSTKIANALDTKSALKEEFGVAANQVQLAAKAQQRAAAIKSLEAQGYSHGQAVNLSEHPGANVGSPAGRNAAPPPGPTVVNLHLDGKQIATAVIPHVARQVRNATAGGGAPSSKY